MINMSLFVVVAMALVSLSSTIVAAGDDCPGAHRNITMEAACREVMAGKPVHMFEDCMGLLGARNFVIGRKSIYKASEYVYVAATAAELDYFFTMLGVRLNLDNASIPGEDKAAYEMFVNDYREAFSAMNRTSNRLEKVVHRLPERCGVDLGDEYRVALRSVGACRDRLAKLSNLPLLDSAKDDYDRTTVAYLLRKLIGIK